MQPVSPSHKRVIAAVAAAAALTAVAIPVSPAAGHASAGSPPKCTTGGLVVWLDTNGSGAAGSVFYKLHFTNLSGHACTLRGFPRVAAVNLAGAQIGPAARHDNATRVRTRRIRNGRTATAILRIVDAGNFSPSLCGRRVTAAGLRVTPPNQSASKRVPFPFAACTATGVLSIRAVT